MELTYRIDTVRGIVHLAASARPTIERWTAMMDRIRMDPAFRPGYAFVADYRRIATLPDAAYVQAQLTYARKHLKELGRIRWAIVVPVFVPAAYAMARAIEALAEVSDITVRGFTEVDAAVTWAALDDARSYG